MNKYAVGDFVHLIRKCFCQILLDPGVGGHAKDCWHSSGTTVRRIFFDGGLLLENHAGHVRVAHPDEVSR